MGGVNETQHFEVDYEVDYFSLRTSVLFFLYHKDLPTLNIFLFINQ